MHESTCIVSLYGFVDSSKFEHPITVDVNKEIPW